MPKAPEIVTFGCRLNTFESSMMQSHAQSADLTDTIIINTCAVTAEAERQAKQTIRKLKRDQPHKKIIVTGCSAQIQPKTYADMPEVSHVLGNQEKLKAETFKDLQANKMPRMHVSDIMQAMEAEIDIVPQIEGQSRVYLEVQNGFDHRCTFCTIPYGRGNSRSVPMGHLFKQVKTYVDNGFNEIVLTGVDITSYGQDLPGKPTLGQMMRRLLAHIPDLPRLRLSSVDPVEIDNDVFQLLATENRLMPHLHISLQAGDDLILKRMKRRHLRHDLLSFCQRARQARPDVVFGADIIAGFPTESEEMFQNTLNIISDCDLTFCHIFPYSPRPGTPAARMPQVDRATVKERAKLLRTAAATNQSKNFAKQVGKKMIALTESANKARAENFMPIQLTAPSSSGQLISVMIESADDKCLYAKPL
ncbi:MAG: tRNA (N(6)-L-threonylcarbamoyladenosine(37)-C(2))-methylthiotransferase MtaB [Alphaproteobacteria bacterium]|nr:MAG: tRNA (N(6)-L-threonylcarbamoyladenosine(37)-C(2))-methylthiotransferase MtaB [Alphaproteobacteria bacterium]